LPTIGVVKPERPGVLQRVFLGELGFRLAHHIRTLCISSAMSMIAAHAKTCSSHSVRPLYCFRTEILFDSCFMAAQEFDVFK
jgi:hypothetical protein